MITFFSLREQKKGDEVWSQFNIDSPQVDETPRLALKSSVLSDFNR